MSPLAPELLAHLDVLLAAGDRVLLGLVGAPGVGKSTVSSAVVGAFGSVAVAVPMDGFHLAQRELERLGRAQRKGAPDTFDAAGFVALLRRLRAPRPDETVYSPEYRRELHDPVAGAIAVPPDARLVVVEGNYLLTESDGFAPVAGLLDETWYLELNPAVRLARLVARHELSGKTPDAARAWARGPDERNAVAIARTRHRATLVVEVT